MKKFFIILAAILSFSLFTQPTYGQGIRSHHVYGHSYHRYYVPRYYPPIPACRPPVVMYHPPVITHYYVVPGPIYTYRPYGYYVVPTPVPAPVYTPKFNFSFNYSYNK